jgi:Sulfotransferase family
VWHFVHIPKTGGSSIEKVLGIPPIHQFASKIERPRFTIVRHPLDRLISAWEFGRMRGSVKAKELNQQTLEKFLTCDNVTVVRQTTWIDDEMDFIGRFENLAEDFAKVSDLPLPHMNASPRKAWQRYFTPEMRKYATNFYLADFQAFGYEIETP